MKPDDLVYNGGFNGCVYGHVDDACEGSVRDASTTSRAAAQRHFAHELGVEFSEVSCRTTYGRFLTRQEVWDEYGQERWANDKIDELDLTCKFDQKRGPGLEAFWYEDQDGNEVPESAIEPPVEVPSDWERDDDDPAWTICKKDDPGATKIYVCELRE